jgi:hypothetical protein
MHLHMGCINACARKHMGCINACARKHMGCINACARKHMVKGDMHMGCIMMPYMICIWVA